MGESEKAIGVLQKTLSAFTGQSFYLSHQDYDLSYPLGVLQVINETPLGRETKRYSGSKEIVECLFELEFQISYVVSRERSDPAKSRFEARRVLGQIAAGYRGTHFQSLWAAEKKAAGVEADILHISGISHDVESEAGERIWSAMSDGRMNVVYTYSEADVPCVEGEASLPDVDVSLSEGSKTNTATLDFGG